MHFQTQSKLWPTGEVLLIGTQFNEDIPFPTNLTATVDNPHASDGKRQYEFVFWNTGRHVTRRRTVHFHFGGDGYGPDPWIATSWYVEISSGNGQPSGSSSPRVRVDPYNIGSNSPITFPPPPGNLLQWDPNVVKARALAESPIAPNPAYAPNDFPFQGVDYNEIGTSAKAVTAEAKGLFTDLQFAGWLKLAPGGIDSDDFEETDGPDPASSTGSSSGATTFDDGADWPVAQGTSADFLATYMDLELELPPRTRKPFDPPNSTDQSPDPTLQALVALDQLLFASMPRLELLGIEFESVIKSVPSMKPEELTIVEKSVNTTVERAQTTLSSINAALEKLLARDPALGKTKPNAERPGSEFQSFIEAAPRMSFDQLTVARKMMNTTAELGNKALSAIHGRQSRTGK